MLLRNPEYFDISHLTREGAQTDFCIGRYERHEWFRCGVIEISDPNQYGTRTLGAKLRDGAMDEEGHSAWAFRFPIVDLQLVRAKFGTLRFKARIDMAEDAYDVEAFRFPTKDYDPFKGATMSVGPDPSPIVPFHPPMDLKLFKTLEGHHIEFVIRLPEG